MRVEWQKNGPGGDEACQRADIIGLSQIARDAVRLPLEPQVAGP
jgi:hypothetical protein